MHSIPLFDLHCDTLYKCRDKGASLLDNGFDISFKRLDEYKKHCQVLAMWSSWIIDDDTAYAHFFEAHDLLLRELEGSTHRLCRCDEELAACEADGVGAVFLAVEGGKLLGDDITRLDTLYKNDVRFLTLVWNATCHIGGGHDTIEGLTDFGRAVVKRCHELGIVPDVSHASDKMTDEVVAISEEMGRPCIATHSNSRAMFEHTRNLTDDRFSRIAKMGGLVGVSLAPVHLTDSEVCRIDDIVRHMEYYLSIGGEDTLCLGCDLDGVVPLPEGIESVSDLYKIADALAKRGYGDGLIEKIFYNNARSFISRNLK